MKRIMFALLAVVALSIAVAVPASASSPLRSFYLEKDCTDFFAGGNSCVVTVSPDPAIPVGSVIVYNGPFFSFVNANVLSMEVVILAPEGTAAGHCTWALSVRPSGACTLARGTGSLAGFHARLSVTLGNFPVFIWNGKYQL